MVEVIVKEKDQEINAGDLVTWKKVTDIADSDEVDVFYVTRTHEGSRGPSQKRVNILLIKSNDIHEPLFSEHNDFPISAFQKFYGEVIFRQ